MSTSGSTSFWQSVLNSKKAIFAGSATVVAWIGGVLEGNGGHNLTTVQWIIAAGAFLGAHAGTYSFTNEKPPRAQLVEGGAAMTPGPAPVVVQVIDHGAQVVDPLVSIPLPAEIPIAAQINIPDDPAVVAAQAQLETSLAAMNDTVVQLQSANAADPVQNQDQGAV